MLGASITVEPGTGVQLRKCGQCNLWKALDEYDLDEFYPGRLSKICSRCRKLNDKAASISLRERRDESEVRHMLMQEANKAFQASGQRVADQVTLLAGQYRFDPLAGPNGNKGRWRDDTNRGWFVSRQNLIDRFGVAAVENLEQRTTPAPAPAPAPKSQPVAQDMPDTPPAPQMPREKECISCKDTKKWHEFSRDASRPDTLSIYCRECQSRKRSKKRAAAKESIIDEVGASYAIPVQEPEPATELEQASTNYTANDERIAPAPVEQYTIPVQPPVEVQVKRSAPSLTILRWLVSQVLKEAENAFGDFGLQPQTERGELVIWTAGQLKELLESE